MSLELSHGKQKAIEYLQRLRTPMRLQEADLEIKRREQLGQDKIRALKICASIRAIGSIQIESYIVDDSPVVHSPS